MLVRMKTTTGEAHTHLTELARIRDERAEVLHRLDRAQFAAVLDARLAGVSWQLIGAALGVSAQAAQKRYTGR